MIFHGSSGIDARGDFYEASLNAAGVATLQIDMWEARGVTGGATRPAAPILTEPGAFPALAFLAAQPAERRARPRARMHVGGSAHSGRGRQGTRASL